MQVLNLLPLTNTKRDDLEILNAQKWQEKPFYWAENKWSKFAHI